MMFLDVAIYFNTLPAETKIIILQLFCLTFEIVYFFWQRKYFDEEERKLRVQYNRYR